MSEEEKANCKERIGEYSKSKEVTWPKIQKVMRQMNSGVRINLYINRLGLYTNCIVT